MSKWKANVGIRELLLSRHWSILSWSFGLLALAIIGYFGILSIGNGVIGAQFVFSEWPDPKISPYFYAKPITWFSYFGFLYWAFGLESNRMRLARLSERTRRLVFIGTALVAFGAFYEIFFNFMLWSAFEVLCTTTPPCNPDSLFSPFPALRNPLNLVFATKVVTMVFALSMYSLWFLHRLDKDIEKQEKLRQSILSGRDALELARAKITQVNRQSDLGKYSSDVATEDRQA